MNSSEEMAKKLEETKSRMRVMEAERKAAEVASDAALARNGSGIVTARLAAIQGRSTVVSTVSVPDTSGDEEFARKLAQDLGWQ